jgi:uncharacterized protein with GYD domain
VSAGAEQDWEDRMPLYITRGNYSSEAMKALMAKPEDRAEAVGKLFAAVGGKLHGLYFTFGEHDFLLIAEAANEKDMAAALIAAAGSGAVTNLHTTVAMTTADAKTAFGKAAAVAGQFRPAGR